MHSTLNEPELFELLNNFRSIINRTTDLNIQQINSELNPESYETVLDISKRDVQILYGMKKNNQSHFMVVHYDPNDKFIRWFQTCRNSQVPPYPKQKQVIEKLYGSIIEKPLEKLIIDKAQTRCPDGDIGCDCSAVFALAYAILIAKDKNPAEFAIDLDTDPLVHPTYSVRRTLKKIFADEKLHLFDQKM